MNSMPFFGETFDTLLLELSRLYKIVRDGGIDLQKGKNPQSGNGQSFVRQTTKYWVHPDNVMELKLYILKNLPVLIYNNNKNKKQSPAINSVYFDNKKLDLYRGRIEKSEGAEAIRLRWYGDLSETDIFVERKTHHEDWTGEKSVKERFVVKEKYVNEYLAGNYDMHKRIAKLREEGKKSEKDLEDMDLLSSEVLESVKNKDLVPGESHIRHRLLKSVSQLCVVCMLPGDATVRISLDTELTMVREDNFDGLERAGLNWRRTDMNNDYPFPQLPERDICRFPYAILEVKLQTDANTSIPAWVANLVHSDLVEAVPKFSKFIHGVSTLLEERVDILPFWFSQMDKEIRKKKTHGGNRSLVNSRVNSAADLATLINLKNINFDDRKGSAGLQENRATPESVIDVDGTGTQSPVELEGHAYHKLPTRSWYNLYGLFRSENDFVPLDVRSSGFVIRDPSTLKDRRMVGSSAQAEILYGTTIGSSVDIQGTKKVISIPARIEPKVFFANERTFLSWLNFAMVLGSLSLALMNFGDKNSKISGAIFTVVTVMVMMYALSLFHWRADRITYQSTGPYYDRLGPTILVLSLFSAIVLNFYFKFKEA
ncbi:Vacuolar transporter chaperone 4 [Zancudomyces culisetae]|uniref:Vacuolar transporter chaperone complex subunit 4 n=1 Tax=Zancudomyces culisetae TaxID=1213189 RepID=A0A1R1PVU1_ZANCU|nr:Vacuolar transporter chaperone 4 [Zancudomyces culisetae]|eukprot:OMH85091.1 Vacuolar transporter chaperone 4 [Zancudomyces culisetae]